MILREKVEMLMQEELERANKKFPLFTSDHEGISVIEEEILEAAEDMEAIADAFDCLKTNVYHDHENDVTMADARSMTSIALFCAAELIQVAAMGQKFRDSKERREALKKPEGAFTPEEIEKFNIESESFQKAVKSMKGGRARIDVPKAALPKIFEAMIEHIKEEAENE